jgi:hypothetical protein
MGHNFPPSVNYGQILPFLRALLHDGVAELDVRYCAALPFSVARRHWQQH